MDRSDRLRKLFVEALGVPEEAVTEDMTLRNTEAWDSFAHLELIVAIESEFGISLSADEIATMTSLAAIRSALARRDIES